MPSPFEVLCHGIVPAVGSPPPLGGVVVKVPDEDRVPVQYDEALTDDEHYAMDLTADLANILQRSVIGNGSQWKNDWSEAALQIHALQHTILRQAAARAYPDRYRLLGYAIGEQPD